MAAQPRAEFQKGFKPPFQKQSNAPGSQFALNPPPLDDITADGQPYKAAGKLQGRTALITGADSGIGRATAILFALEGAHMTLTYTPQEAKEALEVEKIIQAKAPTIKIHMVSVDLRTEAACLNLVQEHLKVFGTLDTLILNHGTQQANTDLATLSSQQWHDVFDTNIHSFFYITKAAFQHMPHGSSIVYNASINMAVGHPELLDYTATKGAMIAFMRGLSNQIVGEKGIRVNAVAPGPIWTPLIPATMTEDSIEKFGTSVPMGRAGQPVEVATCFVFLASSDSSYISGQIIHVNGGVVIN
jgi:NAD(P)-dependent dehydrogenase (short-subunit alcohol dehydrogenase family)